MKENLKDLIKKKASELFPKLKSYREHLHAHPELSFQEFATTEYIATLLKQYNIIYSNGPLQTGLNGILEGKEKGKVILLRADIDALPIQENNPVTYASKNTGIMHACGHDVHSTCLIGALIILNELKKEWKGSIKFIFQPGEEVLPGGASLLINGGILNEPKVDCAIAQHVFPEMETGKVGFRKGMYMASTDEIYLKVRGKGGHAAMPSSYTNPLIAASALLLELNKQFMEKTQEVPTVLAFGKIEGLGATNVIPDCVSISGTFRTMNEEWRMIAHEKMKEIVYLKSKEFHVSTELEIKSGYPFLVNDELLTQKLINASEIFLGKENVESLPIRMTAEDFAYFSQVVPSCFYRIGTGNFSKGITSGVHTSTFDIDEKALEIGSGLMAWLAIQELD